MTASRPAPANDGDPRCLWVRAVVAMPAAPCPCSWPILSALSEVPEDESRPAPRALRVAHHRVEPTVIDARALVVVVREFGELLLHHERPSSAHDVAVPFDDAELLQLGQHDGGLLVGETAGVAHGVERRVSLERRHRFADSPRFALARIFAAEEVRLHALVFE